MITRSSLKREIDAIKSIIAKLADFTEQHNELHTDLDAYLNDLDASIHQLDVQIVKLRTIVDTHHSDTSTQFDKLWNFVQQLDSVEHEIDTKLLNLNRKIDFLDANADAITMWIECVRQTQQLYQESQKPVDTCEG